MITRLLYDTLDNSILEYDRLASIGSASDRWIVRAKSQTLRDTGSNPQTRKTARPSTKSDGLTSRQARRSQVQQFRHHRQ